MKFTMGRTMKIVVAVLIVAVIAIVMLSPYSFEKYTASSKMIQVTSTDTVTKDANGKKKQQVYSFKKDDKKYTEIVNVLDQYSYHFTTKTLTNSSQMSTSSKPQMIMLFGNKMLVVSDSGEILLDNHVYRMGYSGGKDAKNMMKSINKILKKQIMEEDTMGFERLYKNLIDIIKEEQAKLGFRRESIRLYYPLSSLNHFFETEDTEEQMKTRICQMPEFIK